MMYFWEDKNPALSKTYNLFAQLNLDSFYRKIILKIKPKGKGGKPQRTEKVQRT